MRKYGPATGIEDLPQTLYGILLTMEVIQVTDVYKAWIICHDAAQGNDQNRRFEYGAEVGCRTHRDLPPSTIANQCHRYAATNPVTFATQAIEDYPACSKVVDRAVAPVGGDSNLKDVAQHDEIGQRLLILQFEVFDPLPQGLKRPVPGQPVVVHGVGKYISDHSRAGDARLHFVQEGDLIVFKKIPGDCANAREIDNIVVEFGFGVSRCLLRTITLR